MAFYTGKEVKVWLTHESTNSPEVAMGVIQADSADNSKMTVFASVTSAATRPDEMFAAPYDQAGTTGLNVTDLTGIDISIGAVDEDISYFQTANIGKIEVKKETSVTLTRKMSDKAFLVAYQGKVLASDAQDDAGLHPSRWGLKKTSGGDEIASGTTDPKNTTDSDGTISYGYRLHILLKTSGQIFTVPNCTLMSHAVTASNDTANEETIEFMSTVKPPAFATDGTTFNTTATTAANI